VEIHPSVKTSRTWSNNNDSNLDEPLAMITLEDCLQSFINWENLDNKEMFNCKRCKKLQPADKKLDIWKLPPCLVREKIISRSYISLSPRFFISNVFNYQIIVG
jgi:ubiquitin C-terminal hydrolase